MNEYIIRPSIGIKKEELINGNIQVYFYFQSGNKELKIEIFNQYLIEFDAVIKNPVTFPNNKQLSKPMTDLVEVLISKGILVPLEREDWLGVSELGRFDRQLRLLSDKLPLDKKPIEVQQNIEQAKILIVGIGGVGSNIIQQLTFMGFKRFCLIDHDNVEVSNLNRQPLYSPNDIGKGKCETTKKWILNQSPYAIVETHINLLENAISKDIINKYKPDIIVNCADVPSIYETTNLILKQLVNPVPIMVGGGYFLFKSFVGPFIIPGQTACLNCNSNVDTTSFKNISASGGNIMPVAAIVASMSCATIFSFFFNEEKPSLCNKQIEFDIEMLSLKTKSLKRDLKCPVCGHF